MDAAVKHIGLASSEDNFEPDPLSSDELLHFKNQLIKKKQELVEQSRHMIESNKICLAADDMKDEVDLASATIEHELTLRLLDRARKLLREINHALTKFESGDYGYCEGTGEMIPKKRLELAPWVRHSVEHKQNLERRKKILKQSKGIDLLPFE